MTRMVRGRRNLAKAAPPRGAITLAMFKKLQGWLKKQKEAPATLGDDLAVCWGTGLRSSDMEALRASDFSYDKDDALVLKTGKIHDPKASMRSKQLTEVKQVHEVASAVLFARVRAHGPQRDFVVCPAWDAQINRRSIKRAAKELKWPEGLKFDGTHTLRHGLASEVAGSGKKDLERVQKFTGHQSHSVAARYALTNEERLEKAAKHESRRMETNSRRSSGAAAAAATKKGRGGER